MTAAEGADRSASRGAGGLTDGQFWGGFAALLAIAALPVFSVEVPPILDYPNHLARLYLLSSGPGAEALQRYYRVDWQPFPNLAMDVLVPQLARVMPLATAAKTFIVASLGLIAAGAALVHRALTGRWSIWPLFAFLFLYGDVLLLGFFNYLFGLGLAFLGFALWIRLGGQAVTLRLAATTAWALIVFFAHLMACAVCALLILGYELGATLRAAPSDRREGVLGLTCAGLAFLPPVVILLGHHEGPWLSSIGYGDVSRKLDGLAGLFGGYNAALDYGGLLALAAVAALSFARRWLVIAPAMAVPLAALAIAFLASPAEFLAGWGVDLRLPMVLAVMLAAATLSGPSASPWALNWIALAGLCLFLARMSVVEVEWQRADRLYARLLPILDQIPIGSRVALAYPKDAVASGRAGFVPTAHLPVLAVMRRDAFVPTLFAWPGQQPITATDEGVRLRANAWPPVLWAALMSQDRSPEGALALETLQSFDVLVVLARQPFAEPQMQGLARVAGEADFALYRVVR